MRGVPVVNVVRSKLEIPAQLPSIGIERHQRAGIEIVAISIIAVIIRVRISGAVVHEVQCWIITSGHPCGPSAALRDVDTGPGLAAGITGHGNRVEMPEAFATLWIVCIDVTATREVSPGHSNNYFVFYEQRRSRDGVGFLEIADRHVPNESASSSVQRHQMSVKRAHVQPVAEDSKSSVYRSATD